jgi:bifunctional UDP-N-acetylglucosamine pyrophosphorylase/glucosamine-1-phosphate N-acetyltransferase
MLDQPPIFLGGQGGAVGPLRVGYGTVVAAGSVLLDDVLEDGKLIAAVPPPGFVRDRRPHTYRNLTRVVRTNVIYLANLVALENWYRQVREPFFARQEMGPLVYAGALEMLALAKEERAKRLTAMAAKVPVSTSEGRAFSESVEAVRALFEGQRDVPDGTDFVGAFQQASTTAAGNYLETVQRLTPELRTMGIQWLERIVAALCDSADGLLGPMDLFGRRG